MGDLVSGSSANLTITAQTEVGGELTNTASRTASIPVDLTSANDTASVIIRVNRGPEIGQESPPRVEMDEDGSPVGWLVPTLTATDADGDTLTWSVYTDPTHGRATVGGTGPSPDPFNYSPNGNYNGSDSFVVQVSDGNGLTDSITVNVTIRPVNDAPQILGTIPDQTKDEDADPWTLDLTDYESDVEDGGTGLTWGISSVNTSLFSAVVTDPANDIVTFTPVENAHGLDEITLTLTDSEGLTATQKITVTLVSENDPPVIDNQNSLATPEEMPLTINLADLQVTDPDNDYPNDFTLSVGEGSNYSRLGNTITPAEDYNGTLTVPVTVNDGTAASANYNVSVTVTPVNDVPVNTQIPVVSGTLSVEHQLTASTGAWNDDKDTGVSGSSTISYGYQWRRADSSGGANAVDISGAVSSTYTLTSAESRKYVQVLVTATDDGVGVPAGQSAIASSAWNLVANSAPVIAQTGPLTLTMDEDGSPTAWSVPTVTATAADTDVLTWLASTPSHGTATVSGTGASPDPFIYSPSSDYNGTDSFVVRVSDGNGGIDSITVDVTIEPVNDAPGFVKGPGPDRG